jgi:hypothetical protein
MLTMLPPPCASMTGTTARIASHAPRTLTANMRSHSATVKSRKNFRSKVVTAALLTRASTRPYRSVAAATIAVQSRSSETSAVTATASPPAAAISAHTVAAFSPLTSATTTRQPAAPNRSA